MVRVQITEDIVVVLTERRMRLWEAAKAASENIQHTSWEFEGFDWQDWEDLWVEEEEAWAKFFD